MGLDPARRVDELQLPSSPETRYAKSTGPHGGDLCGYVRRQHFRFSTFGRFHCPLTRRASSGTGTGGGDGGESNSPSRTFSRRPLRACPMVCRHPPRPASAPSTEDQSRPLSGFAPDYATLLRSASPLHDASTARGDEAASTLTLRPRPRGRERSGGCQLLRFAACLARPDGTSARVPRGSDPVETTHPHGKAGVRGTPDRHLS